MQQKHDLIEIVRRLAAAGRSEPEIIGQMRAAGFRPAEIDHAIKSVIKERVESPRHQQHPRTSEGFSAKPPPELTPHPTPRTVVPEMTTIPESLRPIELSGLAPKHHTEHTMERPAEPMTPVAAGESPAEHGRPNAGAFRPTGDVEMEELVEEVVEENMRKLEGRLGAIDKRDTQLEAQLAESRLLLEEANKIDKKLQKAFETHNDELNDFMSKFESRIAALEHAFKSLSGHVKK